MIHFRGDCSDYSCQMHSLYALADEMSKFFADDDPGCLLVADLESWLKEFIESLDYGHFGLAMCCAL